MDLIEKVARAMCEAEGYKWAWRTSEEDGWPREYRKMTYAAIAVVLREVGKRDIYGIEVDEEVWKIHVERKDAQG